MRQVPTRRVCVLDLPVFSHDPASLASDYPFNKSRDQIARRECQPYDERFRIYLRIGVPTQIEAVVLAGGRRPRIGASEPESMDALGKPVPVAFVGFLARI